MGMTKQETRLGVWGGGVIQIQKHNKQQQQQERSVRGAWLDADAVGFGVGGVLAQREPAEVGRD